jgi:predicted nucleotidyltransferase component of viral defense system
MFQEFGMSKRRHLKMDERNMISNHMHFAILYELVESYKWTCKNISFQGGTSLHIVWNSPRYSEDLDFLLAAEEAPNLPKIMRKVLKNVQDRMVVMYPDCLIKLVNRTKENSPLHYFELQWSEPQGAMEVIKTKVEFWTIEPKLLNDYAPDLQMINGNNLGVSIVPSASLNSVYHDKLHALADRPYLKWRDLFDIWWMRTQYQNGSIRGIKEPWADIDHFFNKSYAVNAMYKQQPADMIVGLEKFLNADDHLIVEKSRKDLEPFLDDKLWSSMWPNKIEDIVRFVKDDIRHVVQLLKERFPEYSVSDNTISRGC